MKNKHQDLENILTFPLNRTIPADIIHFHTKYEIKKNLNNSAHYNYINFYYFKTASLNKLLSNQS